MNLSKVPVLPRLPDAIARLEDLAYNLWWSWDSGAQNLYARLDPALWATTNHNPVKLLHSIEQSKLDAAAEDADFIAAYHAVMADFDAYMQPRTDTWYAAHYPGRTDQMIAYFSAEFGLHEALPIYSGGLGILSGDHCKAASDLGLPFIGIGFLYPQGYFTQRIDAEGRQHAEYEKIDFAQVPARPALDANGQEVLINVDLPGRTVYAKVWRIQVGRIPIFLMDTDVDRNAPQDRQLSARLYGGDHEMRISQEIVLGMGGVRAVRALGYSPTAWHMNEGHSAFLGLERVRMLVQENNLTFDEAVEAVRANTLFTTHTPVPAGNDAFAFELIDKFFWQYWGQLGITRDRFIEFARQELPWGPQYSMTVLALRLSAFHNGVSELHGRVSRKMWSFLWPDTPVEEVPIGAITNGVHAKTWIAPEIAELYNQYLSADWTEHVEDQATWDAAAQIPNEALWQVHSADKSRLIEFVRNRLRQQLLRHGEGPRRLAEAEHALNPDALTIGFARRFATYKRATLIFHDIDRLKQILHNPDRPVQIIFSGKAHPADEPGKALIQQVYDLSQQPEFMGKIVFIENYDMNVARHLVSGVDVWLNTPRRPREASGTSGQKASLNGIPNFSVLDGWWAEGYDGENGWAIGEEREYKDEATQDEADAYSLYQTLEDVIIPLFYERNAAGVPEGWVSVMKRAIQTCGPRFNMRRMVLDYMEKYYTPAHDAGVAYHSDNYALAREINAWKNNLYNRWANVRIERPPLPTAPITVGDQLPLRAKVWLDGLDSNEVVVEAVYGMQDAQGNLVSTATIPLSQEGKDEDAVVYKGDFTPSTSGPFAIGIRVRPQHPALIQPILPGLIRWA